MSLSVKNCGNSWLIVLIAVFLNCDSCTGQAPKPDSFYISAMGKTRAELLQSGEFFPASAFEDEVLRLSDTKSGRAQFDPERSVAETSSARPTISKNSSSIRFLLFNKDPALGEPLSEDLPDTFFTSAWMLNQPVKLLVHGYKGDCFRNMFSIRLIEAYLSISKIMNIVCMDWRTFASEENYHDSALLVPQAAERLADFVSYLDRSGYVSNFEAIHVIGFCLGGQVAGVAGGILARRRGMVGRGIVGRITGLDPGFPATNERLDSTDAIYVDVIHTNAGSLTSGYLGTTKISGHADFYPNGGSFQPICGSSLVGDVISTCSHMQAVELYSKTIKGTKYMGCNCTDWTTFLKDGCGNCNKGPLMGENSIKHKANGTFYLRT